jgi:hypothetical protein
MTIDKVKQTIADLLNLARNDAARRAKSTTLCDLLVV